MAQSRFICLTDTKELMIYRDGVYVPGEAEVESRVRILLGEDTTRHKVSEVLFYLQVANYVERSEVDADIELLNLENGLLNVRTGELKDHTPDHISMMRIPVLYDPEAECPKVMKFVGEVLHEGDVPIVQETVGYTLWRDHHIQKAFFFLGSGENGKSVLIGLHQALLGKGNCCSVGLQRISENRFATSCLFNKLADFLADAPSRKVANSEVFKALTGGDLICAEKKGKDPFFFTNFAKLIFSANTLPPVKDHTDAFFRRWILISFPNTFGDDRRDPRILGKITTPKELSGFLNWALKGLHRLLERGRFSDGFTTDQIREEYERKSNPGAAFFGDCCVVYREGVVVKDDLHAGYLKYADMNRLPRLSAVAFSRDYVKPLLLDKGLSEGKIGPKGKQKRVWMGIALKDVSEWGRDDKDDNGGEEDNTPKREDITNYQVSGMDETNLDTGSNDESGIQDVESNPDTSQESGIQGSHVKNPSCPSITGENSKPVYIHTNVNNSCKGRIGENLTTPDTAIKQNIDDKIKRDIIELVEAGEDLTRVTVRFALARRGHTLSAEGASRHVEDLVTFGVLEIDDGGHLKKVEAFE